tara:strand:+ start:149 stop:1102 length:954 start_codon:yes stop_codon:yes gene_type:complete
MSLPFARLNDSNKTQTFESGITFSIEDIDRELAKKYLAMNFENNRRPAPRAISNMVESMKNGDFHLSWDCLAFSDENVLVNGQHRLNAIIQSDITCKFFVIRGIPHETIKCFDTGNKRKQADRIAVAGTPMHPKACAIIKLALTDYKSKFSGLESRYGYQRYDDFIAELYKKHSEYFEKLEADGYFKPKYINNTVATAFKIFLEIVVGKFKYSKDELPYDMSAYDRSVLWIELVTNGYSNNTDWNPTIDMAPIKLKEYLIKRRERNETMYGLVAYKYYLIAANYFMRGKMTTGFRIDNVKNDPFSNFINLNSTNGKE